MMLYKDTSLFYYPSTDAGFSSSNQFGRNASGARGGGRGNMRGGRGMNNGFPRGNSRGSGAPYSGNRNGGFGNNRGGNRGLCCIIANHGDSMSFGCTDSSVTNVVSQFGVCFQHKYIFYSGPMSGMLHLIYSILIGLVARQHARRLCQTLIITLADLPPV